MNTKTVRLVQIFVILAVAAYASLVFLGNLMDYNSNYQFVKHVLAMDTTFKDNALMWRSITNESFVTASYWFLIAIEGVIALLAWISGIKMLRAFKKPYEVFTNAKTLGYYSFMLGFLLWFVGFVCLGSEWFAMWQSEIWNGKQTAMDITSVLGIFLIIFMMPVEGNKGVAKK